MRTNVLAKYQRDLAKHCIRGIDVSNSNRGQKVLAALAFEVPSPLRNALQQINSLEKHQDHLGRV